MSSPQEAEDLGPVWRRQSSLGSCERTGRVGADLARGFSSGRPLFSFWLGLLAGSVLCGCNFLADFFACSTSEKGLEWRGLPRTPWRASTAFPAAPSTLLGAGGRDGTGRRPPRSSPTLAAAPWALRGPPSSGQPRTFHLPVPSRMLPVAGDSVPALGQKRVLQGKPGRCWLPPSPLQVGV